MHLYAVAKTPDFFIPAGWLVVLFLFFLPGTKIFLIPVSSFRDSDILPSPRPRYTLKTSSLVLNVASRLAITVDFPDPSAPTTATTKPPRGLILRATIGRLKSSRLFRYSFRETSRYQRFINASRAE